MPRAPLAWSVAGLLAAVVLQVLLKLTIVVEHRVAAFFNARPGGFSKFMRFFCAWLVLFGSKFVILEALVFAFGDRLKFSGPFHGIVALIVVVVVMDFTAQVQAHMMSHQYEGLMKKANLRGYGRGGTPR